MHGNARLAPGPAWRGLLGAIALLVATTGRAWSDVPATSQGDWGVFNAQAGQAAGWGTVTRFGQARWAEDWSWMRDAGPRHGLLDRLKFVRFDRDGRFYVTFSGQERLRLFHESQPFLGTQRPHDADRLLLRSVFGADVHLGPHLRAYAELVDGIAAGRRYYGYAAGTQRTRLDLQQGFVELKGPLLGAQAGAMVGRQMFLDAPPYVLSARDLSNQVQTWNGGRLYAIWPRIRVDLFDLLQTDVTPKAMFADRTNWNARLFGAYASYALPRFTLAGRPSQIFLDPFYYGYLYGGAPASINAASGSGTLAGVTRRDNLGVRLWGNAGPLEFSLGYIHQGGAFRPAGGGASRDVDASSINNLVAYRFASVQGRPSIGLQSDLFSGGSRRRRTVGTYAAPYSTVPLYNDITTYLAPQNTISTGPVLEWAPRRTITTRLHVPVFWRASTNDTVYGNNRIYALDRLRGGFIGLIPQAEIAWSLTPHLTWTHDLAGFVGSRGIRRAGGENGSFYMQTLDFRF